METRYYQEMPSPIGPLTLVSDGTHLTALHLHGFEETRARERAEWVEAPELLADVRAQLEAYFAGTLQQFNLPLRPQGTPFQLRVWAALERIPYATTVSYGHIARQVDAPRASRAVGAANGRNPIAIIVPCHRVIGTNGKLVGYGGGLDRKQWLLRHEAAIARRLSGES